MSNSASIAAAKRRRGTSQNPPVAGSSSASSSRNINRVQSEPTLEKGEKTQQRISPIQILGMHENRLEFLDKKKDEVEKAHKSQIKQLEVISSLSAEEAKEQLVESLKEEAKTDAMGFIQNHIEEAKLTAQQEAKKIIERYKVMG